MYLSLVPHERPETERRGGALGRGERVCPSSVCQAQTCQLNMGQWEQEAAVIFGGDICRIEIKVNIIFLSPQGKA